MLYQLCSSLNVSPYEVLSQGNKQVTSGKHDPVIGQDIQWIQSINSDYQGNGVLSSEEIHNLLQAALLELPPPAVGKIARRIGCRPNKLKRLFPDDCEQITSRYREYINNRHPKPTVVRRVFQAALKEIPPPSLQAVLRRLGCLDTGSYYYFRYRDLCLAVTNRYRSYRNKPFDADIDGARLRNILTEHPPPSFSEVSKRLGHKREFLRKKFPELSNTIVSRYLHHQEELRKEKAWRLRRAIKVAVKQIIASEEYVSEARVEEKVRRQIPNLGRGAHFKQALREVKLGLGL